MPEKIISVKASEQYYKDYKEYALYVERHRTTPELRDGLKPVQRRIVYAAQHVSKAITNRKSATVIGDTMGHYHPHGDTSIQGALYTLVNWYQTKMPLFEGQGNFGNTYEDVPAAARYTEVWLSKFAQDVLLDELIEFKEVIDWEATFDNSKMEPMFLPCKVPLLLVNGCAAIAVGDKIDIPSHNLGEVIDATISLIKNPDATAVLIPDHCQCCEIVDTDWITISKQGYGNYKVRGIIDIEPYNGVERKYKDCQTLVIKSCPNLTFLGKIIKKLDDMVKDNKIIGIYDTEEQSSVNNMRYVIILRPGTDPNFIRSEIYKNTSIQQTCRINLKVIDVLDKDNPVKRVSYTGYINAWIEFRKITKLRYYENKLQRIMTRYHMLENYIWAIESGKSDEAIAIIKKQKNVDDNEIIETLIKKLGITDLQAKFFINCEIKKLSKGYLSNYKIEAQKLVSDAEMCRDSIMVPGRIEEIIIGELLEIKKKYAQPRTCKVISEAEVNGIATGTFQVIVTENNFIKKIGLNDKPTAKDKIKFVIKEDNGNNLLLFDNIGRVYNIPMSKIPFADKGSNGIDLRIINKYINAPLVSIIGEDVIKMFKNGYMFTLTRNGYIKRMNVHDFLAVPFSGLVYSKIDQGDSITYISLGQDNCDAIIYSKNKAIRIPMNSIPLLKRNSRGNMSMSNVETVEGISIIANGATDIVVVTAKGYFNRIIIETIPVSKSKRGSNVIKLSKGDNIVDIIGTGPYTVLNCTTTENEVIQIPVSEIPSGSTISNGFKMIPAKNGIVVKVERIV